MCRSQLNVLTYQDTVRLIDRLGAEVVDSEHEDSEGEGIGGEHHSEVHTGEFTRYTCISIVSSAVYYI